MRLLKYTILTAVLLGAACQSGEDTTKAVDSAADFTLRATSDIRTPSPIKAATFVPNSVASWLGHIILLDNKWTLHRATTDSAETDLVALGKYADIIGLAREKKSGVFLALTQQGQIKAFIQSDNEGNFSPLAVSMDETRFERFCSFSAPNSSTIIAETASGKVHTLEVDIFEDASLTLKGLKTQYGMNPCEARNALPLGTRHALKPNSKSEHVTISTDKNDIAVEITNGLSIAGIKAPGFVTVTSANMGSVFNEGALLIAEQDEGRFVLISRAYAIKELESR